MRTPANGTLALIGLAAVFGAAAAIGLPTAHSQTPAAPRTVIASIRAEPQSFNRYVARDLTTTVITYLMHASLVRVNRATDQLEPELAASWDLLDDRRTFRVTLRQDVRFSDGAPFTADDVVFSFRAIYDARSESLLSDTLQVHGQPLVVSADDASTVTIRFPSPFGPGLRILDGVPIFPRHLLQSSLDAGTFRGAWSVSSPPSAIAGLGPFRLERYEPGQRVTLERNPFYWARDRFGQLPKADRVVLQIMPDQETESLRLQSGDIDFTESESRPADYAALKRAADGGTLTLTDLGVGLDGDLFWINLKPAADSRHQWLQSVDFRRAVSRAVDRDAFVRTVYLGAAVPSYTLVSPGNTTWYVNEPAPAYDPAEAKRLLATVSLVDRDSDGWLDDPKEYPVQFTLLTQRGNSSLERGAALIRESLAVVGVRVDVVALDAGALVERIMSGNYDAAYFRVLTTDTDPALNADFWLSSGSAHVWNPEQSTPSTAWEREADALFDQMSMTMEPSRRRALFSRLQKIVAEQVPALCFAFPRLSFAMNARVSGATPAAFRPPVLWNPSVIEIIPPAH